MNIEIEELAERIRKCAELAGNGEILSQKTAIPRRTLETYLTGQAEPKVFRLVSIAKAAGVSIEWLATGKESQSPIHPFNEQRDHYDATSDEWSEFAKIPIYNVEASAGHGTVLCEEEIGGSIAFRKDWLRSKGLLEKHLATITSKGDSMEPTILNGNLLLINCLEKEVTADSIYVIRSDGRLYVKRLQKMYSGDIHIKSDNPAYSTEVILVDKLNDLKIIGRVVWVGHEI